MRLAEDAGETAYWELREEAGLTPDDVVLEQLRASCAPGRERRHGVVAVTHMLPSVQTCPSLARDCRRRRPVVASPGGAVRAARLLCPGVHPGRDVRRLRDGLGVRLDRSNLPEEGSRYGRVRGPLGGMPRAGAGVAVVRRASPAPVQGAHSDAP